MIEFKKKILFLLFLVFLNSCATKKEVVYFSDINTENKDAVVFIERKIQTNDILNILVSANSAELAASYNQVPNIPNNPNNVGYLVNLEGYITMPVLGKIKAGNLTLSQLETYLNDLIVKGQHLTQPIVVAKLINAKFTVLGEVQNPGTYTFSEQNISLLQALGYAGDLSIFGVRKNILIIREEDGIKNYATIDLTSKEWFKSPYYYVKPNDVIYVNPNATKVKSSGYVGSLATFLSIISVTVSALLTITILTR